MMTSADKRQAKAYNAEYDGFVVRTNNRRESNKLYSSYGRALNYYCTHSGKAQLIGYKLNLEKLSTDETVLEERLA